MATAIGSNVQTGGHKAFYDRVRSATLKLASRLSAEDQMVQSMPDASPTKWHLAHTTWFFETFILASLPGYKLFNPDFRNIFNSYYKQVGTHPIRGTRGTFSRPSLETVLQYREHVDRAMQNAMEGSIVPELAALIELGCHHEQQHQELIVTDIKHAFWSQPLQPSYASSRDTEPSTAAPHEWISFAGGVKEIGSQGGFAFDNELPRHQELLRHYRLGSRLITNREYLEFMQDSGYRRPELWLSDGWDTVCLQCWDAPFYWFKQETEWWVFTASGLRPVALDEPVCHVSYYEADAFARWAGGRLPLESEWENAASSLPIAGQFAESESFHPSIATHTAGLTQMFGDVWEWTASPYTAYPGFRTASGAVGEYNGKFMCNQFVLRGGSCATPQAHIRASYRNFFQPHARWQFMGIRLADDES